MSGISVKVSEVSGNCQRKNFVVGDKSWKQRSYLDFFN